MRTQPRKKRGIRQGESTINLPSEIWKVSEVHHGALLKKPFLIYISYFPPSHFLWKKEGWPSSTVWMLDCYTPTASVAVGVDKTFLFALFSGAPTEDPSPLWSRFRGSGRRLISVPKFSPSRAASKSPFTLHQQWPFSLMVLRFTSFFLFLNVQKSVMHSWNWFETHFVACWCCMEKSQKKFTW